MPKRWVIEETTHEGKIFVDEQIYLTRNFYGAITFQSKEDAEWFCEHNPFPDTWATKIVPVWVTVEFLEE